MLQLICYFISNHLLINEMVKKSKKQQPRMSGEERRNSIVESALELFAEKGFNGTRTREIAKKAGISETLIFQHFKNKQELYRATFEHRIVHHPPVESMKKAMEAKDDAGILREIALHFFGHMHKDQKEMRLSLYAALEGIHVRNTSGREPPLADKLAAYIEQRIKDGIFRKVNHRLAARLFINAIMMYMLDQKANLTGPALPYSDEDAVETLVTVFLGGLKLPRK